MLFNNKILTSDNPAELGEALEKALRDNLLSDKAFVEQLTTFIEESKEGR